MMDELVKAAKETLAFSCGVDENFEEKLKQVSSFLAEKYGFDQRADGLMAILIRHPKATQEWLDAIDLMDEEEQVGQNAAGWLMGLAGIFDSGEKE